MTFAEAVREILAEASKAPERPTPGTLADCLSRQAEKYLDRVRFDLNTGEVKRMTPQQAT